MRQINLKSAVRTLVLAIVMLVAGTALAPQANASKFRGIVGFHYGSGISHLGCGAGFSGSCGIQSSRLFYIGGGVNWACYEDIQGMSLFVNPRFDFFNVSKKWTPFVSGRIGCQVTEITAPYCGLDAGIRFSIKNSKGISLGIGLESIQGRKKYWDGTSSDVDDVAVFARLSFEF